MPALRRLRAQIRQAYPPAPTPTVVDAISATFLQFVLLFLSKFVNLLSLTKPSLAHFLAFVQGLGTVFCDHEYAAVALTSADREIQAYGQPGFFFLGDQEIIRILGEAKYIQAQPIDAADGGKDDDLVQLAAAKEGHSSGIVHCSVRLGFGKAFPAEIS